MPTKVGDSGSIKSTMASMFIGLAAMMKSAQVAIGLWSNQNSNFNIYAIFRAISYKVSRLAYYM